LFDHTIARMKRTINSHLDRRFGSSKTRLMQVQDDGRRIDIDTAFQRAVELPPQKD